MTARILVTGSQEWKDEELPRKVLRALWILSEGGLLVSGGCPRGADAICEGIWRGLGGEVERVRPVWRPGGVLDPAAGFRRSEQMVHRGAGICVAFILRCEKPRCTVTRADRGLPYHGTHGSVHCADYAEDHGIAVRRFTPILAA